MKIAILHPLDDGSSAPFSKLEPPCDPSVYLPDRNCAHFHICKATAVRQVIQIAREGFDVAINLCDGAWDEGTTGIEVVQALEQMNIAFTGAGSSFYDPSREAMKMACHSAGVKFPAYVMARHLRDANRAVRELRFPMLVKHPRGYASVGIFRSCRVTDAEALLREAERTIAAYGAALIEEFVEGREFTVLVAEPRHADEEAWVLEPVEFLFPPGESFKHFDLKWKDYELMEVHRVSDPALAARLREASALTFVALGGSGYGRCDIRMDGAGTIYMLEINPNCAVFYPQGQYGSADFVLANDPAGHRGFLQHVLACAIRRRDRACRVWELQFTPARGFGMFARRAIREGEIVERYEERPQTLVSRQQVERHWRGWRRQWFDQYAWPVTADLHVLWSENPDDWRPINHACDPNTWLEGLNLVARRNIAEGEELTAEYATFCGPSMAGFECQCGATDCRRIILGTDYLLPEIRRRYSGHVSDFVRSAWLNTASLSTSPDGRRPFVIVRNGSGLGLAARGAWRAGDTVADLAWGNRRSRPTRWTVRIGPDQHAEPLPFELRYVNHSCSPNVLFDIDAGRLRALRDIAPGDELHCFYPATEWEMAEPFECQCGSSECVGFITGAAQMPRASLERHALSAPIRGKLLDRLPADQACS
ncbi:MAG: SET domain-containing protein-lysine N-methyltransferase [Terriglobia bacterium]|jgi:D-alanine-D-alanine ligase